MSDKKPRILKTLDYNTPMIKRVVSIPKSDKLKDEFDQVRKATKKASQDLKLLVEQGVFSFLLLSN